MEIYQTVLILVVGFAVSIVSMSVGGTALIAFMIGARLGARIAVRKGEPVA